LHLGHIITLFVPSILFYKQILQSVYPALIK
jgi:hypothetical protein